MVFAVIIANKPIARPDFNVPVIAVAINQNRANRRLVGIADRQALESVFSHQLVTGLRGVGSFWIGTDHSGRDQRGLHVMPALSLRFSMGSLLGKRGSLGQFRIQSRINFSEWMNDRLAPVMTNNFDRCDASGRVAVNKFLSRLL